MRPAWQTARVHSRTGRQLSGLSEAWPEIAAGETGLAEWEVTTPDSEHTVQLQAGFFDLLGDSVTIDGIPVIGLDDIRGHKTTAMDDESRGEGLYRCRSGHETLLSIGADQARMVDGTLRYGAPVGRPVWET